MSKEIKIINFTESLYDIVGDKIREFCEKTYYGDIICSFEQSYDGKEWTKESEFASFENGTDLYYENDWNEGQAYLQNLRIWHLEDSEPAVRCKDCKHCLIHDKILFCGYMGNIGDWRYRTEADYCSRGEREDEVEE